MKKEQISPELNAKIKKNLMWIFIFAVIMIFAGFTSGYIVQQGQKFWVDIKMPSGFNWSTVLTFVSSLFLFLTVKAVKNNKQKLVSTYLGLALAGGILFGVFQFVGFKQLSEKGSTVVSNIMNLKGRYGEYYSLYYMSKEITFDNSKFFWRGEEINEELDKKMTEFAQEIVDNAYDSKKFNLPNYGSEFILKYKGETVTYLNNSLQLDNVDLDFTQLDYLWFFAENIVDKRSDFLVKGEYGKDFSIYYKGDQLEYTHRKFYIKGIPISALQEETLYSERNQASSFIYVFTGMHLLHWLGGVIALLVMFIRGLGKKYSKENYLGITLGSTYWHFLGILWLYLYAFLIFIH